MMEKGQRRGRMPYTVAILFCLLALQLAAAPCTPKDIMKKSVANACDKKIQARNSSGESTAKPDEETMECICARMTWVLQGYHPAMNAVEGICTWWESQGEFAVVSPLARRCEMLAHHLADLQHATYGGQAEGAPLKQPMVAYPVMGAGDKGGAGLQTNDPIMAQRLAMANLDQMSVGGLSTNGPYPPGLAVNGDVSADVFPMPISANVCCEGETRMIVTSHKGGTAEAPAYKTYEQTHGSRRLLRFAEARQGSASAMPENPARSKQEGKDDAIQASPSRSGRRSAVSDEPDFARAWVPPSWRARPRHVLE